MESSKGEDSAPSATVVKLKSRKRKLAKKIRKRRKILSGEVRIRKRFKQIKHQQNLSVRWLELSKKAT